jgi:hypothetical protein
MFTTLFQALISFVRFSVNKMFQRLFTVLADFLLYLFIAVNYYDYFYVIFICSVFIKIFS